MRSRLLWLLSSCGLLLTGALLTVVWGAVSLFPSWEDTAESLHILLVPPLTLLAAVLLALFCQDSGPPSPSEGELDWLIRRKQQGALLHRSHRIRESAARVRSQSARRSARVGLVPLSAPERVLDRLVQLKRHGVWARQK
jgi:hypothetical protein